VPGPRRNADERDAGWFAPVATRRRTMLGAFLPLANGSQCSSGGATPGPPGGPLWGWCSPLAFRSPLAFWVVLAVGVLLAGVFSGVGGGGGWVTGPRSLVLVPGCAWQVGLT